MFELLLSAMSAGGLVGAGNQYACLIILSITAKVGWVQLAPQVDFVQSWWFLGIVVVFWLVTVLPAYASFIGPGAMNAVNTVTNVISGFLVPLSGGLLALAAAGVIAGMDPTLRDLLTTLRIFDPDGAGVGAIGWAMAGGAGLGAAALTGAKFLAKPALSSVSGTLGTTAAPIFATAENVVGILLMVLSYALAQVEPWLIVVLLALVAAVVVAALTWALIQLWRLGKGIGRAIRLVESRPRAGLAVLGEFLVWGSGSLGWGLWRRGGILMVLWAGWVVTIVVGVPALAAGLATLAAPVPVLEVLVVAFLLSAQALAVVVGLMIGLRSASYLMKRLEVRPAKEGEGGTEAPPAAKS